LIIHRLLLKRLAGSPEQGYADYQFAEKSLENCEPRGMSKLTERILMSIDYEKVKTRRYENFFFLHERLGNNNLFELDEASIDVPLCYPYLVEDPDLRIRLIENRIFIPSYWPDAIASKVGMHEITNNLLPLPIDQRYGVPEMEKIVDLVHTYYKFCS
jgi:hypothetical protein